MKKDMHIPFKYEKEGSGYRVDTNIYQVDHYLIDTGNFYEVYFIDDTCSENNFYTLMTYNLYDWYMNEIISILDNGGDLEEELPHVVSVDSILDWLPEDVYIEPSDERLTKFHVYSDGILGNHQIESSDDEQVLVVTLDGNHIYEMNTRKYADILIRDPFKNIQIPDTDTKLTFMNSLIEGDNPN